MRVLSLCLIHLKSPCIDPQLPYNWLAQTHPSQPSCFGQALHPVPLHFGRAQTSAKLPELPPLEKPNQELLISVTVALKVHRSARPGECQAGGEGHWQLKSRCGRGEGLKYIWLFYLCCLCPSLVSIGIGYLRLRKWSNAK